MLTLVQELGIRSAEFAITPLQAHQTTKIVATLKRFFTEIKQVDLVPQTNQGQIKRALAQAVPQLKTIGEQLHRRLNGQYSAILLTKLGISHLDLDTQAAVLYAQSLFIGSPTATDKLDKKVVWDVKTLPSGNNHQPTFSEHNFEAKLHTDTQYYSQPERYMMLYSNKPARCGGGWSTFRDINCIKQALNKTEQGRDAIKVLSQTSLPFRVPMSFTQDGQKGTKEYTYAPVFGGKPQIRYRQDTLIQGLKHNPDYQTAQINQALDTIDSELSQSNRQIKVRLESDALLILNNHECLHGRTEFSDQDRHFFRIRMSE